MIKYDCAWVDEQIQRAHEKKKSGEQPPMMRIRLGKAETGWAIRAGETAILLNVPLEQRLNLRDVVRIDEQDDEEWAGEVLFAYYPHKMALWYLEGTTRAETAERYKRIATALREAGVGVEGLTDGVAGVAYGESHDVAQILAGAGIGKEEWHET